MYDLTQFNLQNATEIGVTLRGFGQDADTLETVAQRSVRYFYENLLDPHTQQPVCVLARFFKTHEYGELPRDLQLQAQSLLSQADGLSAKTKCLTLLATAGDQPNWNDRQLSKGHQVIPLTSSHCVRKIPMMSQLIRSFGLDVSSVVNPDPGLLMELERQTCNVFYIPEAVGSECVPAQSGFVSVFNVKSVLGFGGMLPSGNLFAIILFTKVAIPDSTARLFKALPLNIKMAIMPFEHHQIFR